MKQIKNNQKNYEFLADFEGAYESAAVQNLIHDLRKSSSDFRLTAIKEVPWFPSTMNDLDQIGKKILTAGDGLVSVDHPGFKDEEYKSRRALINEIAKDYKMADSAIPTCNYTQSEKEVWKTCYNKLIDLFPTHACSEFNYTIEEFEKHCGFTVDNIPQLNDISEYLK